jgi:galactokinase
MNPPIRLLTASQEYLSSEPKLMLPVPGRDMWVAADTTAGHEYTVITPDLGGRAIFDRRSAKLKRTVRNRPLPRWARYLAGTLLVLSDDGLEFPGVTAVIIGDEPSGPRYEHALGMAFAAMCYEYHQQECDVNILLDVMERVQKLHLAE